MNDLVDVTEPLHVDGRGRLVLGGVELHPCCLEAVEFGHGECDVSQFVVVPAGKSGQRTFIPHKRKETDGV